MCMPIGSFGRKAKKMEEKRGISAICLAAGRGKRMESRIQKQYLLLDGKPLLYYSLKALQESPVSEVVLVTGAGEEEYCRETIVEPYGFTKVKTIVAGGKERYHSVYRGLQALGECDMVLIQDGARPFLTEEIIGRCIDGVRRYGACVAGMPVKDTIKIADDENVISHTPDRSRLWMIQTPQAFLTPMIQKAYSRLNSMEEEGGEPEIPITDDAMVVEYFLNQKVYLVRGSYENIKITTPEDMAVAEALLKRIY